MLSRVTTTCAPPGALTSVMGSGAWTGVCSLSGMRLPLARLSVGVGHPSDERDTQKGRPRGHLVWTEQAVRTGEDKRPRGDTVEVLAALGCKDGVLLLLEVVACHLHFLLQLLLAYWLMLVILLEECRAERGKDGVGDTVSLLCRQPRDGRTNVCGDEG